MLKKASHNKGGVKSPTEALEAFARLTHERLTEMFIRSEAIRILLEELGVFAHADFEAKVSDLTAQWNETSAQVASKIAQEQAFEQMRQQLESFEGKPQ